MRSPSVFKPHKLFLITFEVSNQEHVWYQLGSSKLSYNFISTHEWELKGEVIMWDDF